MATELRKPITQRTRFRILQDGGFRCHWCGMRAPEAVLQIDHIIPVSQGGSNARDNLVPSCTACNLGKGAVPVGRPAPIEWTVVYPKPGEDEGPPSERCAGEFHPGPWVEHSYPIDVPARALSCTVCNYVVAFRYLGPVA